MDIGFIGCGNMLSAVATGAAGFLKGEGELEAKAEEAGRAKVFAYNRTLSKAQALVDVVGGEAFDKVEKLPPCDVYILGFKPQNLKELSAELNEKLNPEASLVSLLAGTPVGLLEKAMPNFKGQVVRVMPNMASTVGAGLSFVVAPADLVEVRKNFITGFFQASSKVFYLKDEGQMDLVTVVGGSGPAMLFRLASHLESFLTEKGIAPEESQQMVQGLFEGAGKLLAQSPLSAEEQVRRVASKGGTTEAMLRALEGQKLEQVVARGFEAGIVRAREMAGGG